MDDLLDLSFIPEQSQVRSGSTPPVAANTPPLGHTTGLGNGVPIRPSSSASASSSSFNVPGNFRTGTPSAPKKKIDDSFASLASYSTIKKQPETSKSLSEKLMERGQQYVPPKVDLQADWASGLSLDLLDSGNGSAKPSVSQITANMESVNLLDDEDILGPLAKPAQPTPPPMTPATPPSSIPSPLISERPPSAAKERRATAKADPRDPYVAELVDMGFSAEQARTALALTDTGLDVQQAIDVLLRQAHAKTRQPRDENPLEKTRRPQARQRQPSNGSSGDDDVLVSHPDDVRSRNRPSRASASGGGIWQEMPSLYSDGSVSDSMRDSQGFKIPSLSSGHAASDFSKLASGLSTQLKSRAEVLWKQGKKTVAKAVEEYNAAGGISGIVADESNPRWMNNQHKYRYDQDAEPLDLESPLPTDKRRGNDTIAATLEASLLEQEGPAPPLRPQRTAPSTRRPAPAPPMRQRFVERDDSSPTRPTRFVEREDVPPVRQRPFFDTEEAPTKSSQSTRRHQSPNIASTRLDKKVSPEPPKPSIPARPVVNIISLQMDEIMLWRTQGTEAFKRGDFALASELYSKAIEATPSPHLLRTVLLSNRAACLMKLGSPKSALGDAEEGLLIIGPTKGAGEDYESGKSLFEIWVKLMQRRSEALEQLERFGDARDSWDQLVQSGQGGHVAIEGKRRCEKVIDPKPNTTSLPNSARSTPAPATTGPTRPKSTNVGESVAAAAALKRLEKMNAEAEAQDAEKFALHDAVEQRISEWKMGKEDNLRALLASLDSILWAETGWVKVHMADLVLPKKVKVAYMKAVAKTHPDKVSATATTEQKMIAQAVFVSLNRAWDEFKKLNNIQ